MLIPYGQQGLAPYRRIIRDYPSVRGGLAAVGAASTYRALREVGNLGRYVYGRYRGSAPASMTYRRRKKLPKAKVQSNISANRVKRSHSRRKRPLTVKRVAHQVKELKRLNEADMGTLTYRQRATGRILSAVNSQGYSALGTFTLSYLENILTQLRYYNPSSPATLITADATTGSYQKDFQFSKNYFKLCVRNNYQSPSIVSIYVCNPKEDTSITPDTAYQNGLADIGNPTSTSPIVFLTDSHQFNDIWKIKKSVKQLLQPGEELNVSDAVKQFQYDPSLADSHALEYQSRYGATSIFIRVEGVIAHDTAADEQGTIQSGIDWILDRTSVVRYAAGADIEYLIQSNGSDTFTTGAVCSQKPVADNLPYSVV